MGIWDLNRFGFKNGFCTVTLKLRRSPSQAKSSVETKLRAVLLATSLKWAVGWLLILKLQGSYSPPPRPLPPPPPPPPFPVWPSYMGLYSRALLLLLVTSSWWGSWRLHEPKSYVGRGFTPGRSNYARLLERERPAWEQALQVWSWPTISVGLS